MQNAPKIDSIVYIDCSIQIPAVNIFEHYVDMFLVLFETLTKFEGLDLSEVVNFQISFLRV